MTIEQAAKIVHELNRQFCLVMGDQSQPPWEEAPEWQVRSAANGVRFHLENPDALPSRGHEQWLLEKQQTGWVYGPIKDTNKKTHPCMVPYEELPPAQKVKDTLFSQTVKALAQFIEA